MKGWIEKPETANREHLCGFSFCPVYTSSRISIEIDARLLLSDTSVLHNDVCGVTASLTAVDFSPHLYPLEWIGHETDVK